MLGHVRAEPGRHHRQHHPAAQSRHLDRRALPARRHRLRAAPHARDLRVRRPVEGDAGLRGGLPDHDDVVDRAADAERLHRRVPDPAGRVRRQQDVGGVRRRAASCSARPTCSISISGRCSARSRTRRTSGCSTSSHARVRDVRAAARPGGLDGPLSGAVPAPPRDVGAAHRRARQPAVRGEVRPDCNAAPPPQRRGLQQRRGEFLRRCRAVPTASRSPVAGSAEIGADAGRHLARATSTTSCRSWCSRAGALLVLIADVAAAARQPSALAWVTLAGARRDAGVAAAVHRTPTSRSRTG